jgi:hypothetical protein
MQYPPEDTCYECESADNLEWREVSGRGSVNGFVVIHDSRLQAYWDQQPYNVAIIELEENPDIKFFSNLPGTPVGEVTIGANVQVEFEESSSGQLVHEWRVVN